MAGEPKRRHSRQRKGKRRASISLSIPNAVVCPNCGVMNVAHAICKNCGFYKGKEYISKSEKKTEVANS
jgi:large subunit ribosomal protein L32